jgi:hypothetical protein
MADEILDWSKLPPRLRYLAEPAEKYGSLQFEMRILDFLESEASESDLENLRELNRLTLRDEKLIDEWIDELGGLTKHREAALVYFLLHLIALGNDNELL